ncbi:MAG: type VI secretion system-associated FHA domain protein TagH [Pseudomonadota bacterium]
MPISLRVLSYRNEPMPETIIKRFDQLGGSIGRAVGNGLILEDPSKYISRTHARLEFNNGSYVLTDLGSNPSVINERPLGNGRQIALNHGDSLVIGDYQLSVTISPDVVEPEFQRSSLQDIPAMQQVAPVQDAQGGMENDSLAGAKILDFGGAFDDVGSNKNFDPLGVNMFAPKALIPDSFTPNSSGRAEPPAFRGAESDHVSPESQSFNFNAAPNQLPAKPAFSSSANMAIPDDYDPLADYLPPRINPPVTPQVQPQVQVVSEQAAYAPQMNLQQTNPQPIIASIPEIDFAPLGAASLPIAAFPEISNQTPGRSSAATAISDLKANSGVSESEVIQALLRGLGLPDLKINRPPLEVAEMIGVMLREATAGTMGVLMARTMTKRESRLEMTMIASKSNNPLKFFPDAESALTQMLSNSMAGYMPPARSFGNAFDDLKAHEFAVLAGMRAALTGVLQRFDPAEIEGRLKVPTVMDKVLAVNRKAKMWDGLVELYEKISHEADDDFQRLFGEQFAAAYEEQIQRLRQEKR